MIRITISLGALFLSTAILLMGNGLQSTLVVMRANLEAFGPEVIGLMSSAYYAGFLTGCLFGARLIRRVGHIRVFAALAAIAAASALLHILLLNPFGWMLFRALTGFCFAGLYLIIESWINERVDNTQRGQVMSVYRIIDLSANTVGQLMLTLAAPESFTLFALVTLFICLALVPVCLSTATAPAPVTSSKIRLGKLARISPLGVGGCLAIGLVNGAFWGLGPLFTQSGGFSLQQTALFMSACVIGGAVFQWPIGKLSDRFDRRKVLTAIAALASGAGVFLALAGGQPDMATYAGILVFGGLAMPLYSLAISHANDHMDPGDFVEASGGLLLTYAIGATVGPFVAGWLIQTHGAGGLFQFTAAVHASLTLYALYRMTRRAPVPLAEQGEFVDVPRTSPQVFALDPRGDQALEERTDAPE